MAWSYAPRDWPMPRNGARGIYAGLGCDLNPSAWGPGGSLDLCVASQGCVLDLRTWVWAAAQICASRVQAVPGF